MIYNGDDLNVKDAKQQVLNVLDFIKQTDEVDTIQRISKILNYMEIYTLWLFWLLKGDKKIRYEKNNEDIIYVKLN